MFASIIDHLWQSTCFALTACVMAQALSGQSANVRYWVWLTASIKFLIPFALLTLAGDGIRTLLLSTPQGTGPEWAARGAEWMHPMTMREYGLAQSAAAPGDSNSQLGVQVSWISLTRVGPAIWVVGSLMLALLWLRRWVELRELCRRGTAVAIDAAAGYPLAARIVPARIAPGVFGIFKPVLMLPDGILERLTPPELSAIVRHEFLHARRRDNLARAVHSIVVCLFWFHPLVWWIGKRLEQEREYACDEAVLATGTDPDVYAAGILGVCEFCLGPTFGCASAVNDGPIESRIERIQLGRAMPVPRRLVRIALLGISVPLSLAPAIVSVLASPGALARVPGYLVDTGQATPAGQVGESGSTGFGYDSGGYFFSLSATECAIVLPVTAALSNDPVANGLPMISRYRIAHFHSNGDENPGAWSGVAESRELGIQETEREVRALLARAGAFGKERHCQALMQSAIAGGRGGVLAN